MCGIVYSKNLKGYTKVNKTIIKRYKAQKHRGQDGFGFYVPEINRLTHNAKEGRILSLLRKTKATEILFHHRFPTSTQNVQNACHPFSTKDYFENQYIVVHNGVVHNDDELKKEHYKRGIRYVSEQSDGSYNDSEALAYDIALYLEGEQEKINASGSIAFIAIKRDSGGKAVGVFYGRNNGNPLIMKRTNDSITLSSEGNGTEIPAHKLHYFDYDTKRTTVTECPISEGYSIRQYRDYRYDDYSYEMDSTGHIRSVPDNDERLQYFLNAEDGESTKHERYVRYWYYFFKQGKDFNSAINQATNRLTKMLGKQQMLDDKIHKTDLATEAELDEYLLLVEDIDALEEAISKLYKDRGETEQKAQIGFCYTGIPLIESGQTN